MLGSQHEESVQARKLKSSCVNDTIDQQHMYWTIGSGTETDGESPLELRERDVSPWLRMPWVGLIACFRECAKSWTKKHGDLQPNLVDVFEDCDWLTIPPSACLLCPAWLLRSQVNFSAVLHLHQRSRPAASRDLSIHWNIVYHFSQTARRRAHGQRVRTAVAIAGLVRKHGTHTLGFHRKQQ